jgi:hypothetical protein
MENHEYHSRLTEMQLKIMTALNGVEITFVKMLARHPSYKDKSSCSDGTLICA